MNRHSFDPEIAKQVGLNAAVIYQNIVFWAEKNLHNRRHQHDGYWWTYNSRRAFSEQFSYLSDSQIRTALAKLVESGLVVKGDYNKAMYDKTNWFSPAISASWPIGQKSPMDRSEIANGLVKNRQPIPDSKPDKNITPISPEGTDLFSAENETDQSNETVDEIEKGFKEFWYAIWPAHQRKTGKADCAKVYRSACEGKHKKADRIRPAELNRCARAYIASVKELQYLKGPLPWLRLPGWEPFVGQGATYDEADLSMHQKNMLGRGECPPSMLENGKPNDCARYWLRKYGYLEAAE